MNSIYYFLLFIVSSAAVVNLKEEPAAYVLEPVENEERVYITAPPGVEGETNRLLSIVFSTAGMYSDTWISIYDAENRRVLYRTPDEMQQTTYTSEEGLANYTSNYQTLDPNVLDFFLDPYQTYQVYIQRGSTDSGEGGSISLTSDENFWNPGTGATCPSLVMNNFEEELPSLYFEADAEVSIYKNQEDNWTFQHLNSDVYNDIEEVYWVGVSGKTKHWNQDGYLITTTVDGDIIAECRDIPGSGEVLDEEDWTTIAIKSAAIYDISGAVATIDPENPSNNQETEEENETTYPYYTIDRTEGVDRLHLTKLEFKDNETSTSNGESIPEPWADPSPVVLVSVKDAGALKLEYNLPELERQCIFTIYDNLDRLLVYSQPNLSNPKVSNPAKILKFTYQDDEVSATGENAMMETVNLLDLDPVSLEIGEEGFKFISPVPSTATTSSTTLVSTTHRLATLYAKMLSDNSTASLELGEDFLNGECLAQSLSFDKDIEEDRFIDPESIQNVEDTKGEFALAFDGQNDYLSMGTKNLGGFERSLATWFKADVLSGTQFLMGIPGQAALSLENDKAKLEMNIGGTVVVLDGSFELKTETWLHLAGTFDGYEVALYLNGELIASQTQSGQVQASDLLTVGGQADGDFFTGLLDETTIWSSGLSQEEIQNMLDFGVDMKDGDLSAYLNYNQGSNAIAHDISNHGFDGNFQDMDAATAWNADDIAPDWPLADGTDYAMDLTAENQYVYISNSDKLNELGLDFTFEFWAKSADVGSGVHSIFNKSTDWGVMVDNTTLSLEIGGENAILINEGFLEDGEWHHYTFAGIGGTESQFYRDGILIESNQKTYTVNPSEEFFTIGGSGDETSAMITLDDISIWKTARSDNEIYSDYLTQTIDAKDENLIAYYDFNEAPGRWLVQDKTGQSHTGFLTNMEAENCWVEALKPKPADLNFLASDYILKEENEGLVFYTFNHENIEQLFLRYRREEGSEFLLRWWTSEGVLYEGTQGKGRLSCEPIPATEGVIFDGPLNAFTAYLEDKDGVYYRVSHSAPENNFQSMSNAPEVFSRPRMKLSTADERHMLLTHNQELPQEETVVTIYDNQDRLVLWTTNNQNHKFNYGVDSPGFVRFSTEEKNEDKLIYLNVLEQLEEDITYTLNVSLGVGLQDSWSFTTSDLESDCSEYRWLMSFQDRDIANLFTDPDLPLGYSSMDYVLDFQASTELVKIPDPDGFFAQLGSDFSFEFWAKSNDSGSGDLPVFRKKNAFGINIGNGSDVGFYTANATYNFEDQFLVDGVFHHYSLTGQGGTELKLYRDGVLVQTISESYAIEASDFPLILGSDAGKTPILSLDELRIWNNTRIEPQIFEDYVYGIDLEEDGEGLLAYYNFNGGPGQWLLNDETGNENTGVLQDMSGVERWLESDRSEIDPDEAYIYKVVNNGGDFTLEGDLDNVEEIIAIKENGNNIFYSRTRGILYQEKDGEDLVTCVPFTEIMGSNITQVWVKTADEEPLYYGLADVSGRYLPPQPETALPEITLPPYLQIDKSAEEVAYLISYQVMTAFGVLFKNSITFALWEEPKQGEARLLAYGSSEDMKTINYTNDYPDVPVTQLEAPYTIPLNDYEDKVLYVKQNNGDTYQINLDKNKDCFTHALDLGDTDVDESKFDLYSIYVNQAALFEAPFETRNGRSYLISDYEGITGENPRSFEAWISSVSDNGTIASWGTQGNGSMWQLNIEDKKVALNIGQGKIFTKKSIKMGDWFHLAVVMESNQLGDIKIYIDGEKAETTLTPNQPPIATSSDGQLEIAALQGEKLLKGKMEEVRLWNKVLSLEDILANKGRELTGNEEGLELFYNFNEGHTGITIPDNSNNGRDGTYTHVADWPYAVSVYEDSTILEGDCDLIRELYVVRNNKIELYTHGSVYKESNKSLSCSDFPTDLGEGVNEVWIRTFKEDGGHIENFSEYYNIFDFDQIFMMPPTPGTSLESELTEEIVRLGNLEGADEGYNGFNVTFSDEILAKNCKMAVYDVDNERLLAWRAGDKNLTFYYGTGDSPPVKRIEESPGHFDILCGVSDLGNYRLFLSLGDGKDAQWNFKGSSLKSVCKDFKWFVGLRDLEEPEWFVDPEPAVAFPLEHSLSFDEYAYSVSLDHFTIPQKVTIETWIKLESSSTTKTILEWLGEEVKMSLEYANGELNWFVLNDQGEEQEIAAIVELTDDEWHHIALTVNGTQQNGNNAILYYDAIPLANGKVDLSPNTTSLTIGPMRGNGLMDELSIWKIIRTDEEIQKDYLDGVNPFAPPIRQNLAAFYSFNDGAGFFVNDQSANGHLGVLSYLVAMDASKCWESITHTQPDGVRFEKSPYELVQNDNGFSLETRSSEYENTISELYLVSTSDENSNQQINWWTDDGFHYQASEGSSSVSCRNMPEVEDILLPEQVNSFNAWVRTVEDRYYEVQFEEEKAYFNFSPIPSIPSVFNQNKVRLRSNVQGLTLLMDNILIENTTLGLYDIDNQQMLIWRTPEKHLNINYESSQIGPFSRKDDSGNGIISLPIYPGASGNYEFYLSNPDYGSFGLSFTNSQMESSCGDFNWMFLKGNAEEAPAPSWFADPEIPLENTENYVLHLDGTDDQVLIDYFDKPGTMSIEAWVKLDDTGRFADLITWEHTETPGDSYMRLSVGSGNSETDKQIQWEVKDGSEAKKFANGSLDNQWHHFAMTLDGSNYANFYIDGIKVGNGLVNQNPGTNLLRIGGIGFDGKIDDLAIWNTVRSEEENYESYVDGIDSEDQDLAAFYDFNDGPNEWLLRDQTGNEHTGMLQNMDIANSWVVSDIPEPLDFSVITQPYGLIKNAKGGLTFYSENALGLDELYLEYTIAGTSTPQVLWWIRPGKKYTSTIEENSLTCEDFPVSFDEILSGNITSYTSWLKYFNGPYAVASSDNGIETAEYLPLDDPESRAQLDAIGIESLTPASDGSVETGLSINFSGELTSSQFVAAVYDLTNQRLLSYRSPASNVSLIYNENGSLQSLQENDIGDSRIELPLALNESDNYSLFLRVAGGGEASWDFTMSDLNNECLAFHSMTSFSNLDDPHWFVDPTAATDAGNFAVILGQQNATIDLDHFERPGDFTIETWVQYYDGASGDILSWINEDGSNPEYSKVGFQWDASEYKWDLFYSEKGAFNTAQNVEALLYKASNPAGDWYHFAVTRSGQSGAVKIYINGEEKASGSVSRTISTNLLKLGPFDGNLVIDELSIWATAKTRDEIVSDLTSGIDVSSPNLQAYYRFNEGPGRYIVNDISVNKKLGSLNNMDLAMSWIESDREEIDITGISSAFALVETPNVGLIFKQLSDEVIKNLYLIRSSNPNYVHAATQINWYSSGGYYYKLMPEAMNLSKRECLTSGMPSEGHKFSSSIPNYYTAYIETESGDYYRAEHFESEVTEFKQLDEKPDVFQANRVRLQSASEGGLKFIFDSQEVLNGANLGIYDNKLNEMVAFGVPGAVYHLNYSGSAEPITKIPFSEDGFSFTIPLDVSNSSDYSIYLGLNDGSKEEWQLNSIETQCEDLHWMFAYDATESPEWRVDPRIAITSGSDHALQLTNSTNRVVIPYSEDFNLGSKFSIEFWAKRTQSGGTFILSGALSLKLDSQGKLQLGNGIFDSSVLEVDDEWHHYVITCSNNNLLKLYQDNWLLEEINGDFAIINPNRSLTIGVNGSSLAMEMDELKIWKKVLTADQIQSYFLSRNFELTQDLVGHYSFDEGDMGSRFVYDKSYKGNFGVRGGYSLPEYIPSPLNDEGYPNYHPLSKNDLVYLISPNNDLVLHSNLNAGIESMFVLKSEGASTLFWNSDGTLIDKSNSGTFLDCQPVPKYGTVISNTERVDHLSIKTSDGQYYRTEFGNIGKAGAFEPDTEKNSEITNQEKSNYYAQMQNTVSGSSFSLSFSSGDLEENTSFALWDETDSDQPKLLAIKEETGFYTIPYDDNGYPGLPVLEENQNFDLDNWENKTLYFHNSLISADYSFPIEPAMQTNDCVLFDLTINSSSGIAEKLQLSSAYDIYLDEQLSLLNVEPSNIKQLLSNRPDNFKYYSAEKELIYESNLEEALSYSTSPFTSLSSEAQNAWLEVDLEGESRFYYLENMDYPYFVRVSEDVFQSAMPDLSWVYSVNLTSEGDYILDGNMSGIEELYVMGISINNNATDQYFALNLSYNLTNNSLGCESMPNNFGDSYTDIYIKTQSTATESTKYYGVSNYGGEKTFLQVINESPLQDFSIPPYFQVNALTDGNTGINLDFPIADLPKELTLTLWEVTGSGERMLAHRTGNTLNTISYQNGIPTPPVVASDNRIITLEDLNGKILYVRYTGGDNTLDFRFDLDERDLTATCPYFLLSEGNSGQIDEEKFILPEISYVYSVQTNGNNTSLLGAAADIEELYIVKNNGEEVYYSDSHGFSYNLSDNSFTCAPIPTEFGNDISEIWLKTKDSNSEAEKYYGISDMENIYLVEQSAPKLEDIELPAFFNLGAAANTTELTFEFPITDLSNQLTIAIWEDMGNGEERILAVREDDVLKYTTYLGDLPAPLLTSTDPNSITFENSSEKIIYVRYGEGNAVEHFRYALSDIDLTANCPNIALINSASVSDEKYELPDISYDYSIANNNNKVTLSGTLSDVEELYIVRSNGEEYYTASTNIKYDIGNGSLSCESIPNNLGSDVLEVWLKTKDSGNESGKYYGLDNLTNVYLIEQEATALQNVVIPPYFQINAQTGSNTGLDLEFPQPELADKISLAIWEKPGNDPERLLAHREDNVLNTISYNYGVPTPPVQASSPNGISLANLNNKKLYVNYSEDGNTYQQYVFDLSNVDLSTDCPNILLSNGGTVPNSKFELPETSYAYSTSIENNEMTLHSELKTIEDIEEAYVKKTNGNELYYSSTFGISYDKNDGTISCVASFSTDLGSDVQGIWLKTKDTDTEPGKYYSIENMGAIYLLESSTSELENLSFAPFFKLIAANNASKLDLEFSTNTLSEELTIAVWEEPSNGTEQLLAIQFNGELNILTYQSGNITSIETTTASNSLPISNMEDKVIYLRHDKGTSTKDYEFKLTSDNCQGFSLDNKNSSTVAEEKFELPNINFDYSISISGDVKNLVGDESDIEELYIVLGENNIRYYKKYGDNYILYNTNTGILDCKDLPANLGSTVEEVWVVSSENGTLKYYGITDLSTTYLVEQTTPPNVGVEIPDFLELDMNQNGSGTLSFPSIVTASDYTIAVWDNDKIQSVWSNNTLSSVEYFGGDNPTPQETTSNVTSLAVESSNVIYIQHGTGKTYEFDLSNLNNAGTCDWLALNNEVQLGEEHFELPDVTYEYSVSIAGDTKTLVGNESDIEELYIVRGNNNIRYYKKHNDSYIWYNSDNGNLDCKDLPADLGTTLEAVWVVTEINGETEYYGVSDLNYPYLIEKQAADLPNVELPDYIEFAALSSATGLSIENTLDVLLDELTIALWLETPNGTEKLLSLRKSSEKHKITYSGPTPTGIITDTENLNEFPLSNLDYKVLYVKRDNGKTYRFELANSAETLNCSFGRLIESEEQEVSDAKFELATPFANLSAPFNNSRSFGSDYILCNYSGISGSSSRTFEAWIKTDKANRTIAAWGLNTVENHWLIKLDGQGRLRVQINGGNRVGNTSLHDNEWHHIAIVLEEDNSPNVDDLLFYIDGQPETYFATVARPINTSPNGTVEIGASKGLNKFEGEMDEIRIWNIARSEIDILVNKGKELAGPEDGLGMYYKLNEGNNAYVFKDFSNNGRAGAWVTGKKAPFNQRLDLLSGENHIESDYVGITGGKSRTVEAWVKTTDSGVSILAWGDENTNGKKWEVGINGNGKLTVWVKAGLRAGTTTINDDKWHHIAVVLKNDGSPNTNDIKLYVDGKLEKNSNTTNRNINTAGNGSITIGSLNGTKVYSGLMDEVRIWSVARNLEQIRSMMGRELTSSENALKLYYNFNTATDPNDVSGNGNDGVLTSVISNPPSPYTIETIGNISAVLGDLSKVEEVYYEKSNGKLSYYNLPSNFLFKEEDGKMECKSFSGELGDNIDKVWLKINDAGTLKYYRITDISLLNMDEVLVGDMPATPVSDYIKLTSATTGSGYDIDFSSTALASDLTLALWNKKDDKMRMQRENDLLYGLEYAGGLPKTPVLQNTAAQFDVNSLNSLEATNLYAKSSDNTTYYTELEVGEGNAECWMMPIVTPDPSVSDAKLEIPPFNGYLDAASGQVNITTSYKGVIAKNNRTFEARIKTSTGGRTIASWGNNSGNGKKWQVRLTGDGKLTVEVKNGKRVGTTVLTDGNWHHIAVVFFKNTPNANKIKLYVDGVEETYSSTQARAVNTAGTGLVEIGSFNGVQKFKGELDEIRIWNKIRGPNQIKDNMDKELTGNEGGLQLYYNFNQLPTGNNDVKDQTSNGRDGVVNGN